MIHQAVLRFGHALRATEGFELAGFRIQPTLVRRTTLGRPLEHSTIIPIVGFNRVMFRSNFQGVSRAIPAHSLKTSMIKLHLFEGPLFAADRLLMI